MVVSFALKAQYPIQQNLGGDSTIIYIKGAARTVGGFINGTYTDTAAANLTRIRQYEAAQIFTTNDSAMWFRMPGATKWVRFMPATPPSPNVDTSYWSLSGNYVADRVATPKLGTTTGHELNIITNDSIRLTIPVYGIKRVTGNENKYLVIDTTIGSNMYVGYMDGGSGSTYTAGNGLTLSGSQFKFGGTLSENTKVYVDNGYNMNFDLDPGAGSFSVTNDVSDTAFIIRDHINVFFPNIPTVSSTTGRKVALIDTVTGKVEKIDPATLGGSQNLQQVTDNGDTTTNAIQFGKRRNVLGTILSDNYTGGGFGSNYDSSFASVTRTFNGSYLEVTGGNGTFNNYVRYSQWNGLNNWTQSVKFVPTTLTGTSYGVGLGSYSSNSFYASGFVIQFILDSGADKGKIRIWSNNGGATIQTGTSACSFNTTDTLIATVNYLDGVVTATLYNKSQNVSATFTYTFSTATAGTYQAPNTGKLSMYFFGGTQKIFNYTISSNETKNNVVVLGNSITYGYTASELANRWVQKLFPGRYSYETSGGPGDRSAEGVQVLPQIKSLSPKYVIVALGVNDAGNSVSGSTYSSNITTIVDTLLDNGITPILLSNSPLNSTSVVPYNDTLQAIATRWGLTYINTFDSLKGAGTSWNTNYTTDNIHPNDSGHLVIARIVERNVPQILGDTAIYTNRLKYNSDLRYFFGLNEQTGSMELNDIRLPESYDSLLFKTSSVKSWKLATDYANNGTKDFYILNKENTRIPLYLTNTGDVRLGGTSGYAGTQAMTIKQTGEVGIGTGSPGNSLHLVVGNVDGIRVQSSNSPYIELGTTSSTRWAYRSAYNGDFLELMVGTSGASPTTNIQTVFPNGRVQIGSSTDQGFKFFVNGTTGLGGKTYIGSNVTPNQTADVGGSFGAAITTTTTNTTLNDTHYTLIITGGTPTITLPAAASGNSRRIYVIVNQTGSGVTISSYLDFTGAGNTTVAANSAIQIQSNGTNWYRIL